MSQRLTPVSRTELIRRLRRLGWEGPRSGTKHDFMVKGAHKLRLPNPHRGDISVGRLSGILDQADVSRDEWHAARRGGSTSYSA